MEMKLEQHLGNYRVLKQLGTGAFADVYLAEHVYLNMRVAVKVLRARSDALATTAFLTEARHLSRLVHPHIVRVLEFAIEDQAPFLVMEYAPGGNLRRQHPAGTIVPLHLVVSYVTAIASALQYAHDQHLLHRDLKPENLLLGARHEVLLGDFGLAVFTPSNKDGIQVQERFGTLAYMAPEQIHGRPCPASDQYALAVMVYEWLCGRLPFQGSASELSNQHLYTSPAFPPEQQAVLPQAVQQVVLHALSKDPAQRFVDVLSFATAMEEAAHTALTQPVQAQLQALPQHALRAVMLVDPAGTPSSIREPFQSIPVPLMPLLGREQESQTVYDLLVNSEVRLLTLCGAPGVGKTRLALGLAHDLQAAFPHGIFYVPLAGINDSEGVAPAIAHALGLAYNGEDDLIERLKMVCCDKQLLVLDNFEQILPAAHLLADLLVSCPQLRILVTSRAVLHLEGEYVFVVAPLPLPNMQQSEQPSFLLDSPAVELFIQRARAIQPALALTEENVYAIAEICRLLDGLPLAITLAAARSHLLPPQALLARLKKHQLQVLTCSKRDMPAHQQTLRSTLDWSYMLLSADERMLFRRLAIFTEGCTLEAAEVVCTMPGGLQIPVLDGVAALVDNSLLMQRTFAGQEPHFYMLQTIREYGLECLSTAGELEACLAAYNAYQVEEQSMTPTTRASLPRPGLPAPVSMSPPLTLVYPEIAPEELTVREVEVLALIATGLSNNQIAEQLVLSPNTVNTHVQSVYSKLGIHSRSAATRFALEHHLI